MDVVMRYTIEKSKIPVLWLDTFVITQIATAIFNKNNQEPYDEGLLKAYNDLLELRRTNRIIIFESCQMTEIAVRKELVKLSGKILTLLSGGIKISCFDVRDKQISQAIEASINGLNEYSLSWKDIYREDPLKDKSIFGILIRCDLALENRTKCSRKTVDIIYDHWNNIRNEHIIGGEKRNFEKQFELERTGASRLSRDALNAVRNMTEDAPKYYMIYQESIAKFARIVGALRQSVEDPEQYVVDFYNTDYYFDLPFVDIQSKLFAERLCGNESFKKSDQNDIDNISCFLPYVNYMLPDKAMGDKIEKHKIDKKYNTKIIRIGDLNSIIKQIKKH